jgi:hypothetical protein
MSKEKEAVSRYQSQLDAATAPGNTLTIFENGTGLVEGPRWTQGIWLSSTIIERWIDEGYL